MNIKAAVITFGLFVAASLLILLLVTQPIVFLALLTVMALCVIAVTTYYSVIEVLKDER